jgi:ATP-binding cassette, subfamily C, bacterial CydD
VDLDLPAATRTLLTGPSGSGKSTLLSLLLRFTEADTGAILLDRIDGPTTELGEIAVEHWRRHLAWVPQHPYLFDDTVVGNIRLGDPAADLAQVRRAARLAEADDFIDTLPEGYATRLGERGTRLSSGQRRRIALARAFLRDAPVVLLDEPTAHLDPDSAATVRRAVARLLQGRTAVIVAHDAGWSETGAVDRVVRLEGGRVGEGVLR